MIHANVTSCLISDVNVYGFGRVRQHTLGELDEFPDGAPRSTRRKNAKGMSESKTLDASSSDSTLGTFFSLAYAGDRSALIALFPVVLNIWDKGCQSFPIRWRYCVPA
jgi:hypothetical protein